MKHPIISSNFKLLMSHLGLNQQGFADKFKASRGIIETYAQGKVKPKAEIIQRICNYFSITQDQLLKQRLTAEDLQVTGRIKSVTEVQLEEAYKRIELLENTIKDKEKIIELMGK